MPIESLGIGLSESVKTKEANSELISPEKAAITKSLREAAEYAEKLAKQTNTKLIVRKVKTKT